MMLKELRKFDDLSRRERMSIVQSEYKNWENSLGSIKRDRQKQEKLNRDYYRGRFAGNKNGAEVYNWE